MTAASIPVGVNCDSMTGFDSAVARTSQVTRIYHTPARGIPATLQDDTETYSALQAGLKVVVSFKPEIPAQEAQLAAFGSWCQSAAAEAGNIWATVWHEPWAGGKFPSGDAFVAEYMAFQPYAEAAGIGFGPILNTYPYWNHGAVLSSWMPPDDAFSYLGIDVYAGDDPAGVWVNPLAVISPFTGYAKSRGKTFGIAEIAVPSAQAGEAEAGIWLEELTLLGGSARFACWFQCPPGETCPLQPDISAAEGALIPAWQHVFDSLTRR